MTGVGVYSSRLLAAMLDEAPTAHEWTLPHLSNAPLTQYSNLDGVTQVETTADYGSHPSGEVWLNVALRRLLKQANADVFHGPAFLSPWLKTKARRVVTIHDLVCFRYPKTYTRQFAWYMRQVIRLSARTADGVIAVSESTARDLEEFVGVGRDKVRVIHEAADPALVEPPADQVEAVRNRLKLPERYLFYCGTIEPRKGVLEMVRLLERLRSEGDDISLVLAGSTGWQAAPIFAAIEASPERDHIRRLGYVDFDDLPALYRGAQALLYLTQYEGFGLPPLEAMACGCPVVASDRASLPEVVGEAGVLIDPDDEEETTRAVGRLISDRVYRDSLIKQGHARAREFSWRRAARETLEFYEEVAGRS